MLQGDNMKLFNKKTGAKEPNYAIDSSFLTTVWIVYAYQKR